MTNEELLSVAEIVERATKRFNEQAALHKVRCDQYDQLIADMKAEHETKMVEHRAAFGARTVADTKIIAGLREELNQVRNSLGIQAAKQANIALGMVEGEGLLGAAQRVVNERDALRAEIADLRGIFDMVHASLGIKCGDHIGKAIEALKQRSVTTPKRTHPVAVGEYLRRLAGFSTTPAGEVAQVLHVACGQYTVKRPNGQQGVWFESGCEPCDPPADHDTTAGKEAAEAVRDDRKIAPKPGDTVRLVRIPSRDDVSSELKTELEWPWIERWGTLNQTALVVEPAYQLDGALSVCLSTNVYVRWPISCIEVITVAEEIKVGDLVEVVSNRGRNTWFADVGSFGTVTSVEEINESISVHLDDEPGKTNALAGYVSFCDVRKVTT